MATTSFVADVNKTVTIEGETYTLTLPTIPEGVTVTINETQMQAGVPVELTENATLGISVADTGGSFTVNYTNANSVTYNNSPVTNGQTIDVTGDENTLTFTGATTIPSVTVMVIQLLLLQLMSKVFQYLVSHILLHLLGGLLTKYSSRVLTQGLDRLQLQVLILLLLQSMMKKYNYHIQPL